MKGEGSPACCHGEQSTIYVACAADLGLVLIVHARISYGNAHLKRIVTSGNSMIFFTSLFMSFFVASM